MEIIIESSKAWDPKKLFNFYKNKKFFKEFTETFVTDDEVQRFIFANAFYRRVKYDGKAIGEKIPESELLDVVVAEFMEFLDCAGHSCKESDEVDDLFNFIVCDAIYSEMDAVMSLRDELLNSIDGSTSMYFYYFGEIDFDLEESPDLFKYDPNKHIGKKFDVYKEWLMSNNDVLSFIGGSMYLQEVIDPESEIDFDIFYEYLTEFLHETIDLCKIDHNSKTNKTTFSRDLKKIIKFIYNTNKDLGLS